MTRLFGVLQVVCFLVFLGGPVVLPLIGVSDGRLAAEHRSMAGLPALSGLWSAPTSCGAALAAWARDGAPFRDSLILANNRWRLALFGESPVAGAIVGREGWLYYNLEGALEDYLNVAPLSEQDMAEMVRVQTARRDWLAARGIDYLVVFAPNKERVYPEFLPLGLHTIGAQSRLEQIVPRLREAGINVLDLLDPLAAAKASHRTYMRTDTHWNRFGGLIGASALVAALRTGHPAMPPVAVADYAVVEQDRPGGDLAEMLLMADVWRERDLVAQKRGPWLAHEATPGAYPDPADHPDRGRVAMETDRPGWPRAVFFHDSFMRGMQQYVAESFSRSVFLWSHAFVPEIIEAEHPDVVVLEVVERYVFALLVERSRLLPAAGIEEKSRD